MNKRTITDGEVREHDARTKHGWGRWRRTGDDGHETTLLLRAAGDEVETFAACGISFHEDRECSTTPACSREFLTAGWTPLDFASAEPIAGHEDAWHAVECNCGTASRARWNGSIVVVSYRGPIGEWGPEHQYSAAGIARDERLHADKIASAAGASDTFRAEVLWTLINDAMQERGGRDVECACEGESGALRWHAEVRSVDDGGECLGRAYGKTQTDALKRLAVFLGVSR